MHMFCAQGILLACIHQIINSSWSLCMSLSCACLLCPKIHAKSKISDVILVLFLKERVMRKEGSLLLLAFHSMSPCFLCVEASIGSWVVKFVTKCNSFLVFLRTMEFHLFQYYCYRHNELTTRR